MSLENGPEEFGEGNLQLLLVFVLFLEHLKVFLVEAVFFISLLILLLVLVIVIDSILRLRDELTHLSEQGLHTLRLQEQIASLVHYFLDSLSLGNEHLCFSLTVHGLK